MQLQQDCKQDDLVFWTQGSALDVSQYSLFCFENDLFEVSLLLHLRFYRQWKLNNNFSKAIHSLHIRN